MTHLSSSRRLGKSIFGTATFAALLAATNVLATTDLATAPLQTSTATQVKPNIFFVLDDSGSMTWDFMPDWAKDGDDTLVRNSGFNGVYYDPATTYSPPLKYDGSSYPSMAATESSNWTAVPYDGFGIQTPKNIPNTGTDNLFTDSSSGNTQNLVNNAYYYTFIPGEYCTGANLKTCTTQTSSSSTNPYPAMLRWCSNSKLTDCKASRIEDTADSKVKCNTLRINERGWSAGGY